MVRNWNLIGFQEYSFSCTGDLEDTDEYLRDFIMNCTEYANYWLKFGEV